MLARPPLLSLALLCSLTACPGDEPTTTQSDSETATSAATGSSGEPTGSTTAPGTGTDTDPTGSATDPTGSGSAEATGSDVCASRPDGGWNDCAPDGPTNNGLCNHVANGGAGVVTCLSPASGDGNVCGIRDCVDDCDCWAPPTTGTAIATCTVVFGGGGKGCVLYCLNGQICPDGMECLSGTCYWPN